MHKRSINHYIKEWRVLRGLTQKQLSTKIKFSNSAISQLEKGWSSYRQEMLEQLANALDCMPSELLMPPENAEHSTFLHQLTAEQRRKLIAINRAIAREIWGVEHAAPVEAGDEP